MKIAAWTLKLVLLLLLLGGSVYAQQSSIPFEGEFFNTAYVSLQDGVYSMRFAIFTSSGGNRLWPVLAEYEQHTMVIVSNGRFSADLGSSGQPINNSVTQAEDPQVQVSVCRPAGFDCEGFEPLPIRLPLYGAAYMSLATPLPGSEQEDQSSDEEVWEIVELPEGTTSQAWMLSGNVGTNPAIDFLGTTDDTPLSLRVAGLTALRIEPSTTSPNLIGGYYLNSVQEGVYGATISGGGLALSVGNNMVLGNFGTIGGGARNRIHGEFGTVAGGENGLADAYAFVGGGKANLALGSYATIGGGNANRAAGGWATAVGGIENWSSGQVSFIGGGYQNRALGEYSIVVGGDLNKASGDHAIVVSGNNNSVDGAYSVVGGGIGNKIEGSFSFAVGDNNEIEGSHSFIAGGSGNIANGDYSFIAGRNGKTANNVDGSFVWAGDHDEEFESQQDHEFLVRATAGMFVNAGLNASQNYQNTNTAGLRVEIGRTDLDGVKTQMVDIARHPGNWAASQDSGLSLESVAIAGLALAQNELSPLGVSVGVWGQSVGTGIGVLGESLGSDEASVGVMGVSLGSHGVFGETSASEEGRAGGFFRSNSATGRAYGVIGKSNSPDGYGVFSDGNAHVEGALTWKWKTSYLSFGPVDFMGSEIAPGFVGNDREWSTAHIIPKITCGVGDANEEKMLFAPVHLPHGARLNFLDFYFNEPSGDAHSRLILGRSDFNGNATLLADITTTGNYASSRQDSCANHIVDNSSGSYYLFVALDCDTVFYGVTISYEVREPY